MKSYIVVYCFLKIDVLLLKEILNEFKFKNITVFIWSLVTFVDSLENILFKFMKNHSTLKLMT